MMVASVPGISVMLMTETLLRVLLLIRRRIGWFVWTCRRVRLRYIATSSWADFVFECTITWCFVCSEVSIFTWCMVNILTLALKEVCG